MVVDVLMIVGKGEKSFVLLIVKLVTVLMITSIVSSENLLPYPELTKSHDQQLITSSGEL